MAFIYDLSTIGVHYCFLFSSSAKKRHYFQYWSEASRTTPLWALGFLNIHTYVDRSFASLVMATVFHLRSEGVHVELKTPRQAER